MKLAASKGKLFRKKAPMQKDAKPQGTKASVPPYTEEVARKVRERLQGMGYVWHI